MAGGGILVNLLVPAGKGPGALQPLNRFYLTNVRHAQQNDSYMYG